MRPSHRATLEFNQRINSAKSRKIEVKLDEVQTTDGESRVVALSQENSI